MATKTCRKQHAVIGLDNKPTDFGIEDKDRSGASTKFEDDEWEALHHEDSYLDA